MQLFLFALLFAGYPDPAPLNFTSDSLVSFHWLDPGILQAIKWLDLFSSQVIRCIVSFKYSCLCPVPVIYSAACVQLFSPTSQKTQQNGILDINSKLKHCNFSSITAHLASIVLCIPIYSCLFTHLPAHWVFLACKVPGLSMICSMSFLLKFKCLFGLLIHLVFTFLYFRQTW